MTYFLRIWPKIDLKMKVKFYDIIFYQRSLMIKINLIANTGTDLHTYLVKNQQKGPKFDCEIKVKGQICNLFYCPWIWFPICCSKTNSKEIIQHWNGDFSYLQSLGSINEKISVTGCCLEQLENEPHRDYETIYFWHLWLWRRFLKIKLFLAVFHFVFRNCLEFWKHINIFKEDPPRYINSHIYNNQAIHIAVFRIIRPYT
jgi:hypothetical protein